MSLRFRFRPVDTYLINLPFRLLEFTECRLGRFSSFAVRLFLLGLSDVPGEAMVKLYCPKCQDVYVPKSSRHHHTDGAYFGTGFPHMLFMVHPEYRPKRPSNQFTARLVSLYMPSFVTYISVLIFIDRIKIYSTSYPFCIE